MISRYSVFIEGIVQSVGFRPFVHQMAVRNHLTGYVLNNGESVVCEIQGTEEAVAQFMQRLVDSAPVASRIEHIEKQSIPVLPDETVFQIASSTAAGQNLRYLSPDLKICDQCKAELYDERNRRHHFPLINCTQCGPRFSIIKSLPYDRASTTMSEFTMCDACQSEYQTVSNRRFHAEPTCCHACAPRLWICDAQGRELPYDSALIRRLMCKGKVIAYKGIGGFQLICNGTDETAIEMLRHRKKRDSRPFAMMARDIEVAKRQCIISDEEEKALQSCENPIVILRKKSNGFTAVSETTTLGVMLPSSALHCLLFDEEIDLVVATSGNVSGEPIIHQNADAFEKLHEIADYFVFHDRDILSPIDDSIVSLRDGKMNVIRRARGYVPRAIDLAFLGTCPLDILAYGAELKNTFCITSGTKAILSQHIGDLKTYEVSDCYEGMLNRFHALFHVETKVCAFDMHPEYRSTQRAQDDGAQKKYAIQHHHAHIMSCMAENQRRDKVIGVAFDGAGYGDDGAIWGGEFFVCDFSDYERFAHLAYVKMPGGDLCARQPLRMAQSYLYEYGLFEPKTSAEVALLTQLQKGINCPQTSSAGRLFDAVSALIGVCECAEYEAQAAMRLEDIACEDERGHYGYAINEEQGNIVSFAPMFEGIIADMKSGEPVARISMKFHRTIANVILSVCLIARKKTGINVVAFSGGVFQNRLLLSLAEKRLVHRGFEVLVHEKVPSNDGGISLGQVAIAYVREGL